MGATFLNTPEMMLDAGESKMLADAITNVTEHYDIPLLDEKSQAWLGLGFCVATIYGPRVVTLMNKAKKARGPQLVNEVKHG
jgi:hypothetical protein